MDDIHEKPVFSRITYTSSSDTSVEYHYARKCHECMSVFFVKAEHGFDSYGIPSPACCPGCHEAQQVRAALLSMPDEDEDDAS